MSRSGLVVANASDADAGYVGERLQQRGFALRTVLREDDGATGVWADGGPADVIVLLGSEWSVHHPVAPAALAAECDLVRSAHSSGVPVLGICYGAQVIAHALGGQVRQADTPEAGWIEIDSADPELVPAGPWLAFHLDVVTPPPQAEVVARNQCGVQAFALPGLLAVQFHPEVRPDVLADWVDRFPGLVTDAGKDPATVVTESRAREAQARAAAHGLVDAFLDRVPQGTT